MATDSWSRRLLFVTLVLAAAGLAHSQTAVLDAANPQADAPAGLAAPAAAGGCDFVAGLIAQSPDLTETAAAVKLCLPLINATGELPPQITLFAANNTAYVKSNFTLAVAAANTTVDALFNSTAICNIIAYQILPEPLLVKQINETALNGTGAPFADTKTGTLKTAVPYPNFNLTTQARTLTRLWGDLSIKNNTASLTATDTIICGSVVHVVNNIVLPNKVQNIPAWGKSFYFGTFPNGNTGKAANGAATTMASSGALLLLALAAASMLLSL